MLIRNISSDCSRTHFGNIRENTTENTLPLIAIVAMSLDDEVKIKPTVDNYKAYINIQEVKNDTESELDSNIKLAKEAVAYVRSMHLKSSTAMEYDNPLIKYMPTSDYKDIVSDISYLNNRRQKKEIDEYIQITKTMAPSLGVGNCSDQAILAASYLIESKGIKNIALIAVNMPGQNPIDTKAKDQHVFAVIGLDKYADLKNPETWGENAVVVDPWGNVANPVVSGDPGLSAINKFYAIFRTKYMEFTNYSKYIDPTKDSKTPYNWENYRNSLLS